MLSPSRAESLTAGTYVIQPPLARRTFEQIERPDEFGQRGR
jgi:hypothetical protein